MEKCHVCLFEPLGKDDKKEKKEKTKPVGALKYDPPFISNRTHIINNYINK